MNIILAPHLDDEIIGCFSVLDTIDTIIYFHDDYRGDFIDSVCNTLTHQLHLPDGKIKYVRFDTIKMLGYISNSDDTIYIPSKYDYHPLHRKVRKVGLALPGKKMFYSIEMNTPWLEEEEEPTAKRQLFIKMYPGEVKTLEKNDKYFLFKSIKPYDDIIFASVRFQWEGFHCWKDAPEEVPFLRNIHRHMFHFEVNVQQFGDDRDLEYFILSRKIQQWFKNQTWVVTTSCEMYAIAIKRWLEQEYPDRIVEVSCYEDGENGAKIK